MIKIIQKEIKNKEARLITDHANIFYLSGFSGTNGFLVLTKRKAVIFTDFRYREAASSISKEIEVKICTKLLSELNQFLKTSKVSQLVYEGNSITIAQLKEIKKSLKKIKLKAGEKGFVEKYRTVKTTSEIEKIKKSQQITEKAFKEAIKKIKTGITEKQLAWEIEKCAREIGAEGTAFPPIVAFGKNSSGPHHQSSDNKLKKKDIILIDIGFTYEGYCSDMTRTLFTSKPTELQKKVYEIVLKAQTRAIKKIKAGITGYKADKYARDIIKKEGYEKNFGHSLGHGVGLEVHEAPFLSMKYRNRIPKNSVVTVEPGIYLENSFGIRIEDMVLVKQRKVENLTKIPKKIKDLILSIS